MTNGAAHAVMEDLQRIFTQYRFMFSDKLINANGMAILALEKQIPKKPELISIDENTKYTWKCPTCGSYEIFNFCQHCGQKINWEKEPRSKEEEE